MLAGSSLVTALTVIQHLILLLDPRVPLNRGKTPMIASRLLAFLLNPFVSSYPPKLDRVLLNGPLIDRPYLPSLLKHWLLHPPPTLLQEPPLIPLLSRPPSLPTRLTSLLPNPHNLRSPSPRHRISLSPFPTLAIDPRIRLASLPVPINKGLL